MGCGCKKKRVRAMPKRAVNRDVVTVNYKKVVVRCKNCPSSLEGADGEVYIISNGIWFVTASVNVEQWEADGYEFEYFTGG